MLIIKLNEKELTDNYDAILRLLNEENTSGNIISNNNQKVSEIAGKAQNTPVVDINNISPTKEKTNLDKLNEFAEQIQNTLNEKQKKSLIKFVEFYRTKVNEWKKDINYNNLWNKWISNEK